LVFFWEKLDEIFDVDRCAVLFVEGMNEV